MPPAAWPTLRSGRGRSHTDRPSAEAGGIRPSSGGRRGPRGGTRATWPRRRIRAADRAGRARAAPRPSARSPSSPCPSTARCRAGAPHRHSGEGRSGRRPGGPQRGGHPRPRAPWTAPHRPSAPEARCRARGRRSGRRAQGGSPRGHRAGPAAPRRRVPRRQTRARSSRCAARQRTVTRSLSPSKVFWPTSFRSRRSWTAANRVPAREAMILAAVAGPIPGRASSSASVA